MYDNAKQGISMAKERIEFEVREKLTHNVVGHK